MYVIPEIATAVHHSINLVAMFSSMELSGMF